ncbi:MAG: hypothetical protein LQ338_002299 [Usnochroma carphineum]|nr:MAG: hypothetical protein LQ338_002299 [Usnochroma carphineum]
MVSSTSKPALFHFFTLSLTLFFSALLFCSPAATSPLSSLSLSPHALSKRYSGTPAPKQGDGGPGESDYPSDDEIRAAFIQPSGPFVFFSGLPNPVTNQAPYEFSKTINGAQILRNAFPKSYINRKPGRDSPIRSLEWYQNFLDRASGIFADKAVERGDTVYFVGLWDATVLDCSIWKRIELPTLTDGGIDIKLVDYSNLQNQKDYPGTGDVLGPLVPRGNDHTVHGPDGAALEKRGTGYCFDWPGDQEDANDPDADPVVGIPYYPGNCGVHLQQYQKNEGNPATNGNQATSDYRFTVFLKDANGEAVGEVAYYDAPGGQGVDVDGELPLVFIVTAGNVDDDPVSFAYGDQKWDSHSQQCSVGGYDSGSRQLDCGFSC